MFSAVLQWSGLGLNKTCALTSAIYSKSITETLSKSHWFPLDSYFHDIFLMISGFYGIECVNESYDFYLLLKAHSESFKL